MVDRELQTPNKSVWVHLNRDNLDLLPCAVDHKFKIHHGKEDSVVLYRWLSELEDLVPAFSRFYVASGAVVIREDKLLVVQEKNVKDLLCRVPGKEIGVSQVDYANLISPLLMPASGSSRSRPT